MGMDELCDALNAGKYIGVLAPSGAEPTISSAIISFLQSGTAPTTRTVEDVERAIVRSGDFALDANYETRLAELTETIGLKLLEVAPPAIDSLTTYMRWKTATAGDAGDFLFVVEDDSVDPLAADDTVFSLGYNCSRAQGNEDALEPSWNWTIESFYDSVALGEVMEMHFQGRHIDGTQFRNWSFSINRDTHETRYLQRADRHSFEDTTGVYQSVLLTTTTSTGQLSINDGTTILKNGNNVAWLVQNNAAEDGNIEIARINASDNVLIDGSAAGTTFNGRVGVPTLNAARGVSVTITSLTGTSQYGVWSAPTASSAATSESIGFIGVAGTAAASFTCTSMRQFHAANGTKGAGSTITSQTGFHCANMTSGTSNYGFRGVIAAASNAYNLYMDGTAQNYLAGVTGVGIAPSSTAALALAAGTTGVASLRIPHGSAPTSPVNGDIWTTTSGLFVQVNGSTVGPLA
jgi:hypothetical protein